MLRMSVFVNDYHTPKLIDLNDDTWAFGKATSECFKLQTIGILFRFYESVSVFA